MKAWGITLPDRPPMQRAPKARTADALANAGCQIRRLRRRIAELELNEAEVAAAFIDLINTPAERQAALIAEIAGLLGVELPP